MNQINLVGIIAKRPKMEQTKKGVDFVKNLISIEVPSGKYIRLEFVIWNQKAKDFFLEVRKGSLVELRGYLNNNNYYNKDIDKIVQFTNVVIDSYKVINYKMLSFNANNLATSPTDLNLELEHSREFQVPTDVEEI